MAVFLSKPDNFFGRVYPFTGMDLLFLSETGKKS